LRIHETKNGISICLAIDVRNTPIIPQNIDLLGLFF
jgi:hypothetical protein